MPLRHGNWGIESMSEQAVDMSVTARGSLRVGDVLGRSFSVFGRHFLLFVVITAVVTAPNLFFSMKFAGHARHYPSRLLVVDA